MFFRSETLGSARGQVIAQVGRHLVDGDDDTSEGDLDNPLGIRIDNVADGIATRGTAGFGTHSNKQHDPVVDLELPERPQKQASRDATIRLALANGCSRHAESVHSGCYEQEAKRI